jgi:hypothetical protein
MRARTILAAATLAAVLATLAALTLTPASGQQAQPEQTFVVSTRVTPNAQGYVILAIGTNDGVLGVVCGGSNPNGGTPFIPAQVMCQLQGDRTVVRVFNNRGTPFGGVVVRISLGLDTGPFQPSPTLQAKVRSLRAA